MEEDLKSKTVRGVKWNLVDTIVQQGFQVIYGYIIALLLTPYDMGLIGILTVFIAVANNLQESGFGTALFLKKEVKQEEYNAVFYFSVVTSLVSYVLLFFLAGTIADFFEDPILKALSRVMFISFFFSAFGTVPQVILSKKIDYRSFAYASIISLAVSSVVAVVLILLKAGVWIYCGHAVVYHLVRIIVLWYYCGWKPTSHFSFKPLKEMFPYSFKILIANLVDVTAANIVPSVISKRYDMAQAGYYTQAGRWYNKPILFLTTPITALSLPVISSVNDDIDRQKRVLRKMIKTLSFITFPLVLIFAYDCYEFIEVVFRGKWTPIVPYMQLLCLSVIFSPIDSVLRYLINIRGKSGAFFFFVTTKNILILISVFLASSYGIPQLIICMGIIHYVFFALEALFISRLIGYKLRELAKDIFPYLLTAMVSVALVYPILKPVENIYALLLLKAVLPSVLYLAAMFFAKSEIALEGKDYCTLMLKKRFKSKK